MCGDQVAASTEQCDGPDAAACNGPCRADCTCPVCGDGQVDQTSEQCDGSDDAACRGLCQPDCTCPPPVCGNNVREAGEQCDGTAGGTCPGLPCQPDCQCPPPMCGNNLREGSEECDGSDLGTCVPDFEACNATCHCCGAYSSCYPDFRIDCCDPTAECVIGAGGDGTCYPTSCSATAFCRPPTQCLDGRCCSPLGEYCSIPAIQFSFPCCFPGAICAAGLPSGYGCCLLPGLPCSAGSDCCSGSCSATTTTCN